MVGQIINVKVNKVSFDELMRVEKGLRRKTLLANCDHRAIAYNIEAYVDGGPWKREHHGRWHLPRDVSVELILRSVPAYGVQSRAFKVVRAAEQRRLSFAGENRPRNRDGEVAQRPNASCNERIQLTSYPNSLYADHDWPLV